MALVDIEKEDVLDFAAELSTVEDNAWDRILPWVNELDMSGLGETDESTTLARIYLAAHIATFAKPGSSSTAAGPVTSESVGGVRRSYANTLVAATSTAGLSRTRYGQMYSDLLGMSLANGPLLI